MQQVPRSTFGFALLPQLEPPIFACDISPDIPCVVGLEAWFTGAVLGGRRFVEEMKGIALDIDYRMI